MGGIDLLTLKKAKQYADKRIAPAYAMSMFNPAVDIIYDSCYRDVDAPLDVFATNTKTDSGHGWMAVEGSDGKNPVLQYRSADGLYLTSSPSESSGIPGASLIDYEINSPRNDFRFLSIRPGFFTTFNWRRYFFLHFVDIDNWIGLVTGAYSYGITICTEGVMTSLGEIMGTRGQAPMHNGTRVYADIRYVHSQVSPINRAVFLIVDGFNDLLAGLPEEATDILAQTGRVGMAAPAGTRILGLVAGFSGGAF